MCLLSFSGRAVQKPSRPTAPPYPVCHDPEGAAGRRRSGAAQQGRIHRDVMPHSGRGGSNSAPGSTADAPSGPPRVALPPPHAWIPRLVPPSVHWHICLKFSTTYSRPAFVHGSIPGSTLGVSPPSLRALSPPPDPPPDPPPRPALWLRPPSVLPPPLDPRRHAPGFPR